MEKLNQRKEPVEDILKDVKKGKMVIPNFQRPFVWNRTQIKELLTSILQDYYIGAVLLWKCSSDKEKIILDYEGVYGITKSKEELSPEFMILDGQQRISSLFYAVYSPDKKLYNTKKPYLFYIKLKELLGEKFGECVDSDNKEWIDWSKNKNKQFKKWLFPISCINDFEVWLDEFEDYLIEEENLGKEKVKEIKKELRKYLRRLDDKYSIPILELPSDMKLEHVCDIFERINSKGESLTVFDLLNAKLLKNEIQLRKLWETSNTELTKIREFSEGNTKFPVLILQSLSLNRKGYCKRKDLTELKSTNFIYDWEESAKYTQKVLEKVSSYREGENSFGVIKPNMLPYQPMIPIFASLLKYIENRTDYFNCCSKISKWYWSAIFTNSYSGSTDTQMAKDFREMKEWFNDNEKIPVGVQEARKGINDLNLFEENRQGSSIYKSIMNLIILKGAKDFIKGINPEFEKLDDHHIFPQSKSKTFNAGKRINSILNRTLITKKSNQEIQDKHPHIYIKKIEGQISSKEKLSECLSTHFISEKAINFLKKDDFENFIKERNIEIIKEIKGKIN